MTQPQEPVAWRRLRDGKLTSNDGGNFGDDWMPLYTAPPQRKPLSITALRDALVYTNLIDRDAIDDPDRYDRGSTVQQIDALHKIITGGSDE